MEENVSFLSSKKVGFLACLANKVAIKSQLLFLSEETPQGRHGLLRLIRAAAPTQSAEYSF